jgi:hypothetical protein
MNLSLKNIGQKAKQLVKNSKKWVASDVISEEINLRLNAMAIVFPEFAKQLAAAATNAEANRLLALADADKARKALAEAVTKELAAKEQANAVSLLSPVKK